MRKTGHNAQGDICEFTVEFRGQLGPGQFLNLEEFDVQV